MGKHSAVAAHPEQRRHRGGPIAGIAGILATFLAWAALVYYAIRLGSQARSGDTGAWTLLAVAVVGAVCCLFLSLLLGTRVIGETRAGRAARLARTPGGRRAKR